MKIIYTNKLSPFEIAFYDEESKTTFIDSRMKKSEYLDFLIDHEQQHSESSSLIDWHVERIMPFKIFMDFISKKPLWLFSPLMPILWVEESAKKTFGIDFFRMMTVCTIFLLLSFFLATRAGMLIW